MNCLGSMLVDSIVFEPIPFQSPLLNQILEKILRIFEAGVSGNRETPLGDWPAGRGHGQAEIIWLRRPDASDAKYRP
jgi:hypothetical protein